MIFTVCKDYSDITGLRYCNIMEYSGEDFYHKKLNEAFATAYEKKEKLELVLDGTIDGYSPSFIDEAIGNLVYDFTLAVVEKYLSIISNNDAQWFVQLNKKTYPKWEDRRLSKEKPTVTEEHDAWYRLIDGNLVKKVWITPNK